MWSTSKAAWEAAEKAHDSVKALLAKMREEDDEARSKEIAEKLTKARADRDGAKDAAKALEEDESFDRKLKDPVRTHPFKGEDDAPTWREHAEKAVADVTEKGRKLGDLDRDEFWGLTRGRFRALNRMLHKAGGADVELDKFDEACIKTMRPPRSSPSSEKGFVVPQAVKALSTLSPADGGFAVTEEQRSEMITEIREAAQFEPRARVFTTSAQRVAFPTFTFSGTLAKKGEAESATVTPVSEILGKDSFQLHKFGPNVVKVPNEFVLFDLDFNLVGMVLDEYGLEWGEQKEGLWLTGSGNNEPYGILTISGISGQTVAAGGIDVDFDDLKEIIWGLKRTPRNRGVWMGPRVGLKDLDKIQYGDGRYVWREPNSASQPPLLLGRPAIENEHFPDNWTSGSSGDPLLLFGDPLTYWIIQHTSGLVIDELVETYAATDEIGYRFREFVDGAPVKLDTWYRLNRGS